MSVSACLGVAVLMQPTYQLVRLRRRVVSACSLVASDQLGTWLSWAFCRHVSKPCCAEEASQNTAGRLCITVIHPSKAETLSTSTLFRWSVLRPRLLAWSRCLAGHMGVAGLHERGGRGG